MAGRVDPADALAVTDVLLDYARANDVRDVDAIVRCFAPDGSFAMQVAGQEPLGPFDDASEPTLRAFMAATLGAQADRRRHVLTNVQVRALGPDEVTARAYLTLVVTDGGGTAVRATGEYEDVLRRDGDRWLVVRKSLALDAAP